MRARSAPTSSDHLSAAAGEIGGASFQVDILVFTGRRQPSETAQGLISAVIRDRWRPGWIGSIIATKRFMLARSSLVVAAALASVGLLGVACGSSSDAAAPAGSSGTDPTPDAAPATPTPAEGGTAPGDAGPDAAYTVTSLAAQMPQVKSGGGPVLVAPKAIVISFPADPLAASYESFANDVAAGTYWHDTTSEYGVGPLSVLAPVHLQAAAAASLSDDQVHSVLATAIADVANAFPTPDSSTVYTLLIPHGTSETGPAGATACGTGFAGYHSSFALGDGTVIAYAVIVECIAGQTTTRTLAHELAEAATDPFGPKQAAFHSVGPRDLAYAVGTSLGTELGDLCETGAPFILPGVQLKAARIWSNAGASSGHNPCLPVPPGEQYFMTLPTSLPDTVAGTLPKGMPASGSGFALTKGQSRVVELGLMSDPGTAAWTIAAHEVTPSSLVTFTLDKTSGVAGDRIMLTMTATGDTTAGVPFAIDSTLGATTRTWFGLVGTP
jgi:hypothetical protein